jgi:hypothetical protein
MGQDFASDPGFLGSVVLSKNQNFRERGDQSALKH